MTIVRLENFPRNECLLLKRNLLEQGPFKVPESPVFVDVSTFMQSKRVITITNTDENRLTILEDVVVRVMAEIFPEVEFVIALMPAHKVTAGGPSQKEEKRLALATA